MFLIGIENTSHLLTYHKVYRIPWNKRCCKVHHSSVVWVLLSTLLLAENNIQKATVDILYRYEYSEHPTVAKSMLGFCLNQKLRLCI